ncbi:type I polyketide synthase [Actinokineospora terrae]|uniref:Amino acid adenylation domain-containing protein n=1 Tax=Actinokineospora terrae TaxID=155974 RepID=A0A1H9NXQ5_9PSEU|nr:type I polyketide synthase [Actinokineospora terrae]SER40824.1 amino acid adenylation domain-containing protein [Actinokineospora terrae]
MDDRAAVPVITVHGLVERVLTERPAGPVAVVQGNRQVSYPELDRMAQQVSSWLLRTGVGPGSLVALHLRRGPELFAAMLGVLKAGACYVPMDVEDPVERLRAIAEDADIAVLVTDGARPVPFPATTLVLDDTWQEQDNPGQHERAPVQVDPDSPAYAVFTSGSTGRPKGVPMTHRSLVNLLWWHERTRPGANQSRTAQVCAVSFDFSFHEVFATLCFGGTLVVADEQTRRDPFALAEFLERQGIERLFAPVTTLTQLADAAAGRPGALAIRDVVTTGERLRVTPALREFFGRTTGGKLHNHYGATEFQDATTHTLDGDPATWPATVPIGRPITGVEVHVLDGDLRPVPEGELYVGGVGVASGYLNRPEETTQRFLDNPFGPGRLYRTGDLARILPDGTVDHLGRADDQVKIHGARVEPGEVEAVLESDPRVREAVVLAQEVAGVRRLVAHVVITGEYDETLPRRLHRVVSARLPRYMVPEAYEQLAAMPRTASGKTDRRALIPPEEFERLSDDPVVAARTPTERVLSAAWREVLGLDEVSTTDNFFDIGGTSLHLVALRQAITDRTGAPFPLVDLFGNPTIRALAAHLDRDNPAPTPRRRARHTQGDIAIIGMAGRFPGAGDVEAFWRDLVAGVESITGFDDLGEVDPALRDHPDHVRAAAVLPGVDRFDAAFFDINAREAAATDPQHRIFLECAWEAFEDAGHRPGPDHGAVGVFAGSSLSTYLVNNITPGAGGPFVEADLAQFQAKLGNDRNYLPTRVSYKLDLRGPSVAVQTACSTSLVAVHLACQSLRSGESDMALAGGVSVIVPQHGGYLYEEGMVRSRDGHCRAFDARADGTLFGNGCGVVLLKPLAAALADGDRVIAVVKGSAVNNDGSAKVGFTAPSVQRQAEVVADALADAGVPAGSVGYVEAHGTGTAIGDPIEVAALNTAFQVDGPLPENSCVLGSVKSNIGHLDEAAGIAGLVKAALAVERGTVPPTVHFTEPNPEIDFGAGPFFVSAEATPWPEWSGVRRAGVSSFGMGGTNCHVVLEQAPERPEVPGTPGPHLLAVSARTPEALRELVSRYGDHLAEHDLALSDVCATAATGRHVFGHRFAAVVDSRDDARQALESFVEERRRSKVAFLFSGQGSQYPGMGRALYEEQPVFREAFDECAVLLSGMFDLHEVLADDRVNETAHAQPALFAVEYALAKLWLSLGVRPDVLIGHSVGEFVAAHLAGVFSLMHAVILVAHRGRLMQELDAPGRMVSVAADEATVAELVAQHAGVSIAAVNGPTATVISGAGTEVEAIRAELDQRGVRTKELVVSHAFHSPLMQPMVERFAEIAAGVTYHQPTIPVVATSSGDIATPEYWVDHVLNTVRFGDGVRTLVESGVDVFIEVSAKPTLLSHVDADALLVPTLRPEREREQLLRGARDLFTAGIDIDLAGLFHGEHRKVALPTYPWQRERHWIDPPAAQAPPVEGRPLIGQRLDIADSDDIRFQATTGPRTLSWLGDHRVFQSIVMPGVAFLETGLAAHHEAFGGEGAVVRDFFVHRAMPFADENTARQVQIALIPEGGEHRLRVHSRAPGDPQWTLHASGITATPAAPLDVEPLSQVRSRFTAEIPVEEIYQGEREREIDLGPLFWATERLWRDGTRCLSEIALPAALRDETEHRVHPVLLEACFLALTVTYPEKYGRRTYVPVGVERLTLHSKVGTRAWCHARLRPSDSETPETLHGDVDLFDADGTLVLTMRGVLLKLATRRAMLGAEVWRDWLYATEWVAAPACPPSGERPLVITGGEFADLGDTGELTPGRTVVVCLPAESTSTDPADLVTPLLRLVREVGDVGSKLVLVTRGAQQAGTRKVTNPAQAALWGLGRVIALEHPDLDLTLVDLDPDGPTDVLAHELSSEESQVAYQGSTRYVARLSRATAPATAPAISPGATYLITGGLGGLGLETARLLHRLGARRLALVGRSAPSPDAEKVVGELRDAGVEVRIAQVDVTDPVALEVFLGELDTLRGVFHLAGVLDDGVLVQQTPERFRTVLGPKADAAWHLHRLTEGLDHFVLFSSISSALGSPGQGNYATANAFLDGLAEYRRGLGLPALAVQWGSWADTGMSARLGLNDKLTSLGEGVIPTEDGLSALGALLGTNGVRAVLPIDWPKFLSHQINVPPVLARFQLKTTKPADRSFRQELDAAPEDKRRDLLAAEVREQVVRSIGTDNGLGPDVGFFSLGLDSLSSIELRNRLQAAVGEPLGQTVVFDYPTLSGLTDHLVTVLGLDEPAHDTEDVARLLAAKLGLIGGGS